MPVAAMRTRFASPRSGASQSRSDQPRRRLRPRHRASPSRSPASIAALTFAPPLRPITPYGTVLTESVWLRYTIRQRMEQNRLGRQDWMRAARLALLHGGPEAVRVE